VSQEFFDLEVYAIYSAITELYGQKGWSIVWRSGEIAFDYIKDSLNIKGKEPIDVLKNVSNYLESVGYAKKLKVIEAGKNEFIYEMYSPLGRRPVRMLKEKHKDSSKPPVLPHFSTALLFAALKDICKMKAEITHLEHAKPGQDPSREKWVLKRLGQ
jgi:hypothetical protein